MHVARKIGFSTKERSLTPGSSALGLCYLSVAMHTRVNRGTFD
jgi:hypothetical protein